MSASPTFLDYVLERISNPHAKVSFNQLPAFMRSLQKMESDLMWLKIKQATVDLR